MRNADFFYRFADFPDGNFTSCRIGQVRHSVGTEPTQKNSCAFFIGQEFLRSDCFRQESEVADVFWENSSMPCAICWSVSKILPPEETTCPAYFLIS